MTQSIVARRYAKALFEVAQNRQLTDQIEKELELVNHTLANTLDLLSWLRVPTVDINEKKSFLSTIFSEVSEPVQNLLFLLCDRHRLDQLDAIAAEFRQLNHEQKGIVDADVLSAFPLSSADEKQLMETFQQLIGKQIQIHSHVDSDLLGGVIVKIGDRVYDGSLQTKLKHFRNQLQRSKVERLG